VATGPPGTGKSTIINQIINTCVDLEYGSRVLCACARNQAVDALTEKLTHFEPLVSSSFFVTSSTLNAKILLTNLFV
jgi:broad-specificity NMP kinase